MKLVRGSELKSELLALGAQSTRRRFAVAFWGDGAGDALGLTADPSKVEIVCNLCMGGTNPKEIRRLRDLGASVKHSDTLHAKIYLFDQAAVVGSSNVSSNGLSLQGGEVGGWMEANVLFGTGALYDETGTLFDEIWENAREVSDPDLADAQAAWDRRRRASSHLQKLAAPNILEALKSQPKRLADRGIFITVDFVNMSPAAERAVAKVQKESGLGDATDAWEGWPTMPNGAYFISFTDIENSISFNDLWRSPDYRREIKVNGGDILCFVDKAPDIFGMKKIGSLPEWRKLIRKAVKACGRDAIICLEAGEFAREFL